MRTIRSILALCLALAAAGAAHGQAAPQPTGWKALLIAGDDRELAFDNAVDAMARKLASFGIPAGDITILKASGDEEEAATAERIRDAFAALDPGPGDGCFVFATSHGTPGRGLLMQRARAFLSPRSMGVMLDSACGLRPTVVIASGCFSGIFAEDPPMPASNRTILTAARDDRPSFGCSANLEYTVFDRCILDNLASGLAWRVVMDRTRGCVSGNEWDLHVKQPSEPQISIGAAVADLLVFGR